MGELLNKLLDAIKGLTFVNIAVLALLMAILVPVYFGYRILADPMLMGAVFNVYKELETKGDCQLSFEQPSGAIGRYVIRAVLAERNRETWYVSAKVTFAPDDKALIEYCDVLTDMVNFARDPYHQPVPTFPGSDRKIVPIPTPAN